MSARFNTKISVGGESVKYSKISSNSNNNSQDETSTLNHQRNHNCLCINNGDAILRYLDETEEQMKDHLLKNKFGDFPLRYIVSIVYRDDITLPSEISNEIYSYLLGGRKMRYFLHPMFYDHFYWQNKVNHVSKIYIIPSCVLSIEFMSCILYLFCFINIQDDDRTDRKWIVDVNNYTLSAVLLIHAILMRLSIKSKDTLTEKFQMIDRNQKTIKACYCDIVLRNPNVLMCFIYQWVPFNYIQVRCSYQLYQLIFVAIYFVSMLMFNIATYLSPNGMTTNALCWIIVGVFMLSLVVNIYESQKTKHKTPFNATYAFKVITLVMTFIVGLAMISFGVMVDDTIGLNVDKAITIYLPTPSPTASPTFSPTFSPTPNSASQGMFLLNSISLVSLAAFILCIE
eukprot:524330_1